MEKRIKTRISLRRDYEYNYSPDFVPLKGEILFVDTSDEGKLKFKVGDGTTTYSELSFLETENAVILWGYYFNSNFYQDSTYTIELPKSNTSIYIDKNTKGLYIYDGVSFTCIEGTIPNATEENPGIMKLYKSQGTNEDGTMTQKIISDGISTINFSIAKDDNECLVLNKPW